MCLCATLPCHPLSLSTVVMRSLAWFAKGDQEQGDKMATFIINKGGMTEREVEAASYAPLGDYWSFHAENSDQVLTISQKLVNTIERK